MAKAKQAQAPATQAPATKQATTYATPEEYAAAGRFVHVGTFADGTKVVVAHVFRRRYVIYVANKPIGYVTASDPVNVINRVEGTVRAELKLH